MGNDLLEVERHMRRTHARRPSAQDSVEVFRPEVEPRHHPTRPYNTDIIKPRLTEPDPS